MTIPVSAPVSAIRNQGATFSRRSLLGAAGLLAASAGAGTLLAGCGGGGGTAAGGSSASGGTLTFGGLLPVAQTLDIHKTIDPWTYFYCSPMYNGLLQFTPGTRTVEADIAREWDVSADGLTYRFRLRDDVHWHDKPPVNGRRLVADDVVATYRRAQSEALWRSWFEAVDSIEAPDDTTVELRLSRPYSPFLEFLAHHYSVILPREGIDGGYDLANDVIGTGPFVLESWDRETEFIRVRHPEYHIEGRPHLDELISVVVPQPAANVSAMRSGRLDWASIQYPQFQELVSDPQFGVQHTTGGPSVLLLNQAEEPFTDLRVRRAIQLAVDWTGMAQSVRGRSRLISTLPEITSAALPEDEVRRLRPHDPGQARRLLDEAGLPPRFNVPLLVQDVTPQDVQEGQWISEDLAEIGIDVTLEVVEFTTALQRQRDRAYTTYKGLRAGFLADQFLQFYETDALENYSNINSPRLQQMIEQSRGTTDERERMALYQDIQRFMEAEDASVIYATETYHNYCYNTRVQGFQPYIYAGGRTWADVSVSDA